jgi:hypothetical protein
LLRAHQRELSGSHRSRPSAIAMPERCSPARVHFVALARALAGCAPFRRIENYDGSGGNPVGRPPASFQKYPPWFAKQQLTRWRNNLTACPQPAIKNGHLWLTESLIRTGARVSSSWPGVRSTSRQNTFLQTTSLTQIQYLTSSGGPYLFIDPTEPAGRRNRGKRYLKLGRPRLSIPENRPLADASKPANEGEAGQGYLYPGWCRLSNIFLMTATDEGIYGQDLAEG